MADIELVVRLDQETLQDLYDSRYVSPHIKEVFRSATRLPKGHDDLIDAGRIRETVHRNTFGDLFDQLIDMQPTIIGADKEQKVRKQNEMS